MHILELDAPAYLPERPLWLRGPALFSFVLVVMTAELAGQHPDPSELTCTECHGETMLQDVVHQSVLKEMCTACHQYVPQVGKMKIVSEEAPLCTSCHLNPAAGDGIYHPGSDERCALCHNPHETRRQYQLRSTSGPFNHFKTSFALMGRHREIQCLKCHPLNRSSQSGTTTFVCQDCHEERHRSSYVECGRCHSSQDWGIREW